MTDQPAPTPTPRPRAAPAQAWRAADLTGHAARWNTTPAIVRAALNASGKDTFATPEEAQAIVDAFRKQDVVQLEKDARAAREKGA